MTENFISESAYLADLEKRGQLPRGFRTASVPLLFLPSERPQGGEQKMMLSMILMDEPSDSFAGVFTSNRFPGSPVIVGKERMDAPHTRGVIINNRIANVCSPTGIEDIERLLSALSKSTGGDVHDYFSSSTGIIGWQLPVDKMISALPDLLSGLNRDSALKLAKGIMTTDSFPKIRSIQVGGGRIVAVAKGAGMIEPNMGTMLCFIMTDLDVSRFELRGLLPGVAERTFNRVSVDGDQSTSDMVLVFSSKKAGKVDLEEFRIALEGVMGALAEDIVRNGEGTAHVIKVNLTGASDDKSAGLLARAVVNSPLVKTAVAGNDPNVGRIISSLGDCAGNLDLPLDPRRVSVSLGGTLLFKESKFMLDAEREEKMSAYLKSAELNSELKAYPEHSRTVDIDIDLGLGGGVSSVFGSDLTHEYVSENADYRT
ncbi:MAG: bifunctional glutamate N-acetyltransferase/amino-acid acetyltransferase ArgJ [Spirochaetales bacterium]|nr:bifunctional glutamate N-acetyltransferase/amino-acid acetyltransferase ArgJ [Spirochaetales bacterium]